MKPAPRAVTCPYCQQPAQLVDSREIYKVRSYGMAWLCRPCDAYVGCHRGSADHAPLGRLANKELRQWKMRAHEAFDPLWGEGRMSRGDAYRFLSEKLGLPIQRTHIGMFDVDQCRAAVQACREFQAVQPRE